MNPSSSLFFANVRAAVSMPRTTPVSRADGGFKGAIAASAGALVHQAEWSLNRLPGGPMIALALRGGAGSSVVPSSSLTSSIGSSSAALAASSAEGPAPTSSTGDTSVAGGLTGGVDGSIAQAQEMNLYYLRVQERVNEQNRAFTTLSNVLKAEHETVKTAIGNIR